MSRGAIILAGGRNSRMGREKWLLPVGNRPVLARMVDVLKNEVEDIIVVLPYGMDEQLRLQAEAAVEGAAVRWFCDRKPGGGPLEGLRSAFPHCSHALYLVAAGDMPFIRWEVAKVLFEACEEEGTDAAVPVYGGKLHPLFSVYRVGRVLPSLDAYWAEGRRKVGEWTERLNRTIVSDDTLVKADPSGAALFNMNTKTDYEMAKKMAIGIDGSKT